jgi:aspartyl-tRNA(Asn)/glutamyl-tRNA(Gln) amidotransferase subunit C
MNINLSDVEYLAELSALEFSEQEKQNFLKDLDGILEMVNQLKQQNADENNVFNKSHNLNELREDVVGESLSQEEILLNAPKQRRGCFSVPLVVE